MTLFQMFIPSSGGSKTRGWLVKVWHVVVFSIWKTMIDMIFSSSLVTPKDVEDISIILVLKWYLCRSVEKSCAFSFSLENLIMFLS